MPECPYCHVGIDEDIDMFDFETYDDEVHLYYTARCYKCRRTFKWREIYMLKEPCDNFEEVRVI